MSDQYSLPQVPVKHQDFLEYVRSHSDTPVEHLLGPYLEYDVVLRKLFAQQRSHPVLQDNHLNLVPIYGKTGSADIPVRARNLALEPNELKEKYIMALKGESRRSHGSPAVVPSFKEFQTNFNIFSETSLIDIDWNNVVAAGSAVVTSLMPVPDKYRGSKRQLRHFYHKKFAPASDVDLFLYGLTEEQAIKKIEQIEAKIKDSILTETTSVRSKNAITIVSQYPTRHVQIVLRIYKSVSEILTGFDVDCSCAAYDGKQVYVAPRALASYMTQINRVDLTRRSPSYENRLSKYSHRGFEIFWPELDRSKIDPTIFERSFARTVGLARLLVLERLPLPADRDFYLDKRREERGRPARDTYGRDSRQLKGNIKDDWDDEVPEWLDDEDVSNYHTFTIPYGERFHAKKIEKLLYTKDLLLNAEWNNKDREVNLHRHPAFFGDVKDIIQDCCGDCPEPVTAEEKQVAEEEAKLYISGSLSFIQDDPGRQEIGSFNPTTESDWTEMAYVGNTERLCQAIVDHDLETVKNWLAEEGADPNRRDYTGRAPLHLASSFSTPGIVQCLVNHGSRLIARLADGNTALHLAASRGSVEIVRILLTKSGENEEAETNKEQRQKKTRDIPERSVREDGEAEDDVELLSRPDSETDHESGSEITGSFVNVKKEETMDSSKGAHDGDSDDLEPDIYDVNVLAWDSHASPLHLAILNGHVDVVEELVASFGADVLLPVKLFLECDHSPLAAILTLVLALRLPPEKAKPMTAKLLQLGASPAQGDLGKYTPLHYIASSEDYVELFDILLHYNEPAVKRAVNYLIVVGIYSRQHYLSPLMTAIRAKNHFGAVKLLEIGANPVIGFADFVKHSPMKNETISAGQYEAWFQIAPQPIYLAVMKHMPLIALRLLERGANPNIVRWNGSTVDKGTPLLDWVQAELDSLRNYKGDVVEETSPRAPLNPNDDFYLKNFDVGTYKMFYAQQKLKVEREYREHEQRKYERTLADSQNREGLAEKKAAIKVLIQDFEKLKAALLEKGAKTFEQMFPGDENKTASNPHGREHEPPNPPFKVSFEFSETGLTDTRRDGYLNLFEAAWRGDIDTIKELTLTMWGEDHDQPPLKVAVDDGLELSPFSVAVLRKHRSAAESILKIVGSQHKPEEETPKRYVLEEDYYTGDEYQIRGEVVDDQFTAEDVAEVGTKVESDVSPLNMLLSPCAAKLFLNEEPPKRVDVSGILQYAIYLDDVDLLSFILDLWRDITNHIPENIPHIREAFTMAISLKSLRCLSLLIKRTAAGLPLDELVETYGAAAIEKPKYYQGLSIHGKKRSDWAAAGSRNHYHSQGPSSDGPPLLISAHEGCLESVEWFLSTAPERQYMEFVETHKSDKRIERLLRAEQGIQRCITNWLQLRENLVLHCAVLSVETDESVQLVQRLVDRFPYCLEIKSASGYTPLALAFSQHRTEFAKILVDAGANQAVRDAEGNNILHLVLREASGPCLDSNFLDDLRKLLQLIDPLLVSSLLVERAADEPGSVTPLSSWIHRFKYYFGDFEIPVGILRLILDFSKPTGQKHLELLDAAGNTPVHDVIKYELPMFLELMIDCRPDLLHRENAMGLTPLELAVGAWVNEVTGGPPELPGLEESYNSQEHEYFVDIPSSIFVNGKSAKEKSNKTVMYELCRQKTDSMQGGLQRKLVTLYEANTVAKRLASKQTNIHGRRDSDDRPSESNSERDEVDKWLYSY